MSTVNIWLLVIAVIALSVAGLWLVWRGRRFKRAAQLTGQARPYSVKCHIKTFEYLDGHKEVRHSFCSGGVGLEGLTDALATEFHTEAPLVKVTNLTHVVVL